MSGGDVLWPETGCTGTVNQRTSAIVQGGDDKSASLVLAVSHNANICVESSISKMKGTDDQPALGSS